MGVRGSFWWGMWVAVGVALCTLIGFKTSRETGLWCAGLFLALLLVVERIRAGWLLRALRADSAHALPRGAGLWGQLGERVRRLLTDREQRAAQAEGRLQEFLDALIRSPNGIVLLDDQGRIEWCNQTAHAHLGLDPQRDRLQAVSYLLRDPAFADYLASWNYSREVVLTRQDPGVGGLKIALQVHAYAGGRRLVLSRDVTAVEQAEAMRRDFVANVSHEIRTPLTVLAGFVETLQTLPLHDEERQKYLGLMATQAGRMQSLVSDLLALSKLESGPPPGLQSEVDAHQMLLDCEHEAAQLSNLLSPGQAHQIAVLWPGPGRATVAGSADELRSAVSNLLHNAVRYTPPGGRIELAWVPRPDGSADISVRDSGTGIAPEHLPRLTERFYRVDRSRSRETGGTGLGLAIVKHVAQRHGGELRIDSSLGQGSCFTLHLPASRIRLTSAQAV